MDDGYVFKFTSATEMLEFVDGLKEQGMKTALIDVLGQIDKGMSTKVIRERIIEALGDDYDKQ